jgi:hypothetical protein
MVECVHLRKISRLLVQITDVSGWAREHQDLLVTRDYVSKPALEQYIGAHYTDTHRRQQMFYRLNKAKTVEIESHSERNVEYASQAEDEAISSMFRPYYEKLYWDPRLPLQAIFEKYATHLCNCHHESKGVLLCSIINLIRERGEQSIDDLLEALPQGRIMGDKRATLTHMIKSASIGTLDFFERTPNENYDLTPKYK